MPNFLGYEQALNAIFPETVTPATLVNGTSNSSILGDGKIDRTDKVNTKVAAIVVQVLPNGNLVIEGRQETRVNAEVRELAITGIVRPQDITTSNTINYEQVAEARLAYGGRGIPDRRTTATLRTGDLRYSLPVLNHRSPRFREDLQRPSPPSSILIQDGRCKEGADVTDIGPLYFFQNI